MTLEASLMSLGRRLWSLWIDLTTAVDSNSGLQAASSGMVLADWLRPVTLACFSGLRELEEVASSLKNGLVPCRAEELSISSCIQVTNDQLKHCFDYWKINNSENDDDISDRKLKYESVSKSKVKKAETRIIRKNRTILF